MSLSKILTILIALLSLIFSSEDAIAQNQKVDSVLTLIASCKKSNTLDTAKFERAQSLIQNASLSDKDIEAIEKATEILDNEKDQDLSFILKLSIFINLSSSDPPKSITFAKEQVEAIRNSDTPHKIKILSNLLAMLRLPYRNSNRALEGVSYFTDQLKAFQAANDSTGISICYYVLSGFYLTTGLMDQAIYNMKKSLVYIDTTSAPDNFFRLANIQSKIQWYNNSLVIGYYYTVKGDYEEGMTYLKAAFDFGEKESTRRFSASARYICWNKVLAGRLDSIDYYLKIARAFDGDGPSGATVYQIEALAKIQQDSLIVAERLMQHCWELVRRENIPVEPYAGTVHPDYYLALIRIKQGQLEEAIALLDKDIERLAGVRSAILEDLLLQADLYFKTKQYQKSADTYKNYILLKDSLLADQNKFRTASFEIEQELSGKELAISKLESENKVSMLTRNYTIGLAVLLILLAVGIYLRFRSKQKANRILEQTLSDLKNTQTQLIQSEKMASLGELTAGIAHEIQNPLNFVNNFSELNKELIIEMREEIAKGNYEVVDEIAKDVEGNEEKIITHGKRADAIVKGMLQHSRTSAAMKEPTDINALCDEYLRLSYHGLRAKDRDFNADLKTDFDESLGKINMVAQDIGRVLLNLFNNAFYAVNERAKTESVDYKPLVSVSTKSVDAKIEIRVSDNGNGIPDSIKEKIFQPFFTTKPTGQGTGLGLSLSYDIIKAHGGELNVETKEGKGTTFIIQLPAA